MDHFLMLLIFLLAGSWAVCSWGKKEVSGLDVLQGILLALGTGLILFGLIKGGG